MDFQMFIVQNAVLIEFYKKLLILKYLAEFKIAVGHRPFLTKIGYFRQYVKVFSLFLTT